MCLVLTLWCYEMSGTNECCYALLLPGAEREHRVSAAGQPAFMLAVLPFMLALLPFSLVLPLFTVAVLSFLETMLPCLLVLLTIMVQLLQFTGRVLTPLTEMGAERGTRGGELEEGSVLEGRGR